MNFKDLFFMKTKFYSCLAILLFWYTGIMTAQERRPIDSQHPLWMIHVDVWNSADPQKIIDLIPSDIKPFVCMNLSLSCGYDTETNMYRMPRCAVRTYKSWASVCQQNGMWFTCQPASGGHTHIQDDDLETFEYFFKTYPNFLGWNYAEQFWGFDEANDESSSTQASRLALFAKLVPMHHQYGGFLTVSFCGNIWSHGLNPLGMMKRNSALLKACQDYPEAILWLYKYTTSSCWYNNESVTYGPFIAGLANNYGVRYDNCGWNGALSSLYGENSGKTYPGSAGLGTVMEQTCVNGGAVWDGPELIWTEDFKNLNNSTVDGYTRRNWGTFDNFKGVWQDMFRQILVGNLYIPTRQEVLEKTKIVVVNDKSSGSDEDKYAAWGTLYDGIYKQTDPFNRNNGQWMDNFCYFKKTGRYGAIPVVIGLYDDLAKAIPVQVKKSSYTSRWGTTAKKTADFNAQYPEVSTGDLYVNRFKNQLIVYTPHTYSNGRQNAEAEIPLQYNTCDTLKLNFGKLSSGAIREYADHIDFYLNNYRSDSTAVQTDQIIVTGVTSTPSYKTSRHSTGASGYSLNTTANYDAENHTYTVTVKHMGPVNVTITCSGAAEREELATLPAAKLEAPKQPDAFVGPIVIEAENMDYKDVKSVALTHSGWWATDMMQFAGMGYVEMGTNSQASLRHNLKLATAGEYDIYVRYCGTSRAGNLKTTVNGTNLNIPLEKTNKNEWRKAKITANLKAGTNTLVLTNSNSIGMYIDQIIYAPAGTPPEKFKVTIREVEHGRVVANVNEAAEGDTVTLTIIPDKGYSLKELRVTNSIFYTMDVTIPFAANATKTSFVMTDDNMTIRPTFTDNTVAYKLDFTNVLNGNMPEGWRANTGSDVHEYPNSYSSGPRTFQGFTGYQGKALYWHSKTAEYGRQAAYPLNLQPGKYKLTFAMAAWKGTPKYKARIISPNNTLVVTTTAYTATPNANGSFSANLSSATLYELPFEVTEAGNYIISFLNNGSGYDEFLLLECRVNVDQPAVIKGDVNEDGQVGIGDIIAVTNFMAEREQSGITLEQADVNEDGQVGIGDIIAICNIMAGEDM